MYYTMCSTQYCTCTFLYMKMLHCYKAQSTDNWPPDSNRAWEQPCNEPLYMFVSEAVSCVLIELLHTNMLLTIARLCILDKARAFEQHSERLAEFGGQLHESLGGRSCWWLHFRWRRRRRKGLFVGAQCVGEDLVKKPLPQLVALTLAELHWQSWCWCWCWCRMRVRSTRRGRAVVAGSVRELLVGARRGRARRTSGIGIGSGIGSGSGGELATQASRRVQSGRVNGRAL